MGKISATILGAIVGGFAAAIALVWFFGWGSSVGNAPFADVGRADYVDFLLMLVTVLLAAIGLAVTIGALVIGLVALKTLREIKDEAASEAKAAAAAKLGATLPSALQAALVDDDLGHKILREMAQRGELDEVLERVANRMQGGEPESEEEGAEDPEG
ncbi:hypothetical protein [Sphingopyxis sp.]|uniref:hypothetical protein n=1 Tax=Sphingopyxis sp. TaxID=1908224 RepID=UPI002D76A770|nr:hypothetical protein [Sphingopyxis sp.]HET6524745.1 hypothetical protein [Sphingopyxis sp.]